MKKLVIGITGGIGSGKSTVSDIITENNYTVLKTDDIAKKIMNTDSEVKHKITSQFGNECYMDGKLNTKHLAQNVFDHPDRISKLNKIVHPPTIEYIENETKVLLQKADIVFVESALIYEAKMQDLFDYILLITSEEDTRIKRVLKRDKETISEIKSRIMNQIPEEQKRSRAHFVIENNSSIEELKSRVIFFLSLFNSLLK